jgi:hypothetical protein
MRQTKKTLHQFGPCIGRSRQYTHTRGAALSNTRRPQNDQLELHVGNRINTRGRQSLYIKVAPYMRLGTARLTFWRRR